jgi:hypothetical protein
VPRLRELGPQGKLVPDDVSDFVLQQRQERMAASISPAGGKGVLVHTIVRVEVFEDIRIVEEGDKWPPS